ncbi:MAG: hypothetical protein EHM32_04405 [Spirochaetales bacterium]|nr:MAG: hypothetical protein EHM32_04405 [Spirochaetales bacterium]
MRSSRYKLLITSIILQLTFAIIAWNDLSTSARASTDRGAAGSGISYVLLPGGTLHSADREGIVALPIGPGVERFIDEDGILFYLRVEDGKTIAGRWMRGDTGALELVMGRFDSTPWRLRGSGKTLYALYGDGDNEEGILYSADFNTEKLLQRKGVLDFTLYQERPVLLERRGAELLCVISEVRISILLTGKARFRDSNDPRMLSVSDGSSTEVVDAATARTVYRYAEGVRYRTPGAHNLEVEAIDDTPGLPSGRMIFYKVLINGIEAGRTDTGPAQTRRVSRHAVAAGVYQLVAMERWELNLRRERYERANNIMQPEPLRLFVPEGLVLRILLFCDGRSYRVVTGPAVESVSE